MDTADSAANAAVDPTPCEPTPDGKMSPRWCVTTTGGTNLGRLGTRGLVAQRRVAPPSTREGSDAILSQPARHAAIPILRIGVPLRKFC